MASGHQSQDIEVQRAYQAYPISVQTTGKPMIYPT